MDTFWKFEIFDILIFHFQFERLTLITYYTIQAEGSIVIIFKNSQNFLYKTRTVNFS